MSPLPAIRRWAEPSPVSEREVAALERELEIPRELALLLARRGLGSPEAARRFLRPSFSHLHPIEALPGLRTAVERLRRALEKRETVLVHGDYDADGLTAAALLTRGLRELGGRVEAFVPHRTRDGYDLGPAGLERAISVGADLVLTADCGVRAVEAVRAARRAGLEVIVTDHHRPGRELPEALALVHPAPGGSAYPFAGLAGVGVAYHLLRALQRSLGRPPEAGHRHLDLVALGTVADLVPLVDENRALVRAGLTALERTAKPGLRALQRVAGVEGRPDSSQVAFRLAPRLNAAGRVGEPDDALRLLLTEDASEAAVLAERLEETNRVRRGEGRKVEREAEERLADLPDGAGRAVVLWDGDWHPGVIGIAASRLVERYHRPAVLVSLEGDRGRGSGRSVPGFPLHEALEACAPLLERFGGHRMAAGFEIRRERLEAFARRLEELAREALGPSPPGPVLEPELAVSLERVDLSLEGWLRHLAPFGQGNPRPLLVSRGVRFERPEAVGAGGDHLRLRLADGASASVGAIGFGMGERLEEAVDGGRWEVVYELVADRWRSRRRLQARLVDFRPC